MADTIVNKNSLPYLKIINNNKNIKDKILISLVAYENQNTGINFVNIPNIERKHILLSGVYKLQDKNDNEIVDLFKNIKKYDERYSDILKIIKLLYSISHDEPIYNEENGLVNKISSSFVKILGEDIYKLLENYVDVKMKIDQIEDMYDNVNLSIEDYHDEVNDIKKDLNLYKAKKEFFSSFAYNLMVILESFFTTIRECCQFNFEDLTKMSYSELVKAIKMCQINLKKFSDINNVKKISEKLAKEFKKSMDSDIKINISNFDDSSENDKELAVAVKNYYESSVFKGLYEQITSENYIKNRIRFIFSRMVGYYLEHPIPIAISLINKNFAEIEWKIEENSIITYIQE